jgi:hypothetical protein
MEPLKGNSKLGTAFASGEFMYLIDDHEPDLCEMLSEPLSHEKCLNSFRGGDQEIGRGQGLFASFSHRRVSMPHTNRQPKLTAPPLHTRKDIAIE